MTPSYLTNVTSCRLGTRFFRSRNGARDFDVGHFAFGIAEHFAQDLFGVLAEQRRPRHLAGRVRHLDWIADGQILAARRMIDLDHRAGRAQRRLLGDLLHGQDRADRNIDRVAEIHYLEFGLGHGPGFDGREDVLEPRQPRRRRRVVGIGLPLGLADQIADCAPHRRLSDEIDVGVGIGLPALAFEDPAWLAAARIVAGARHRLPERNALAELAVFIERTMLDTLLIAKLDPAQVEHAVLHGCEHALAAPGAIALIERADDPKREMQPGAGVADLRAGHQWRAFAEAGGRGRATGALRHVLIDLAVLVRSWTKALHRGDDHARVELMDVLPGEPH